MYFDAQRHPNPHNFEPERWMNGNWEFSAAEAAAQKDPTKRDHFAYGVGRRICPGIHVAETTLFLLVSRVLWMFNIRKVDEMGREIDVDVNAYAGGGLAKPSPFKARIVPRSESHAEILRQDWSQCTTVILGTLGDVDQKQMDDLDRIYTDIYGSK